MRPMDYAGRIRAVKDALKRGGRLDGILITHEANVRYLCGFPGQDLSLLITRRGNYCITDSRYIQEAREICGRHYTVTLARSSTFEAIGAVARKARIGSLGFEGMRLPYGIARRLKAYCGGARVWPTADIVENIRAVKEPAEVAAIRRSIGLARQVFERTARSLKPGMTEKAVADSIEIAFLRKAARPSFPAIVASGAHASKPHARPRVHRIRKDGFVMVDMGCNLDGYCSDMTRMLVLGRVDGRFRRIYHIVQAAQELAIAQIKPGVQIAAIDRAARSHIEEHGYGAHFAHALGHGVGLEIHEHPNVSARNHGTLQAGMVITIEPAIYIPGYGGVRIEDMVLVTPKGCEILTR